jgi:hypothetical protein
MYVREILNLRQNAFLETHSLQVLEEARSVSKFLGRGLFLLSCRVWHGERD